MIHFTPIRSFYLGPVEISTHGLMIAVGILLAYILTMREAKKLSFDPNSIDDIALWAVVGGVVGSRLLYVILNPQYYANVIDIFKIWEGGLVSFGGLIGGFLAVFGYLQYKKISFLSVADILAPYVLLGWGIARIGDFVSWSFGEFGTPTDLPWAVQIDNDLPRHPNQLYTFVILVVGFAIIRILQKKQSKLKKFNGYYFCIAGLYYFIHRFFIEFVRDYPGNESIIFYRNFAQLVSVAFIIIFVILFFLLRRSSLPHHKI